MNQSKKEYIKCFTENNDNIIISDPKNEIYKLKETMNLNYKLTDGEMNDYMNNNNNNMIEQLIDDFFNNDRKKEQ